MKKIITFLLMFLVGLVSAWILLIAGEVPAWIVERKLPIECALAGGVGGVIYCLRAVYMNACVHKRWDNDWQPWYYIRPFVSLICGWVSWLFLKTGLLVLSASHSDDASDLGFYALALVAGLNVDKFISKVEDIAQAVWGIEKSRASKDPGSKP